MCGIIAAAANQNIGNLLIDGLHKMEYRGYDSAGIAIIDENEDISFLRSLGKVSLLEEKINNQKLEGHVGIAHTRWATHGEPSEQNAHPHFSSDKVYIVHNGIIENHLEMTEFLKTKGYEFTSQTDSELIAHLLDFHSAPKQSFIHTMQKAIKELDGAFAIAAIEHNNAKSVYLARNKSPLLIGIGDGMMLAASDPLALGGILNKFIFLEDGDVAKITKEKYKIFDKNNKDIEREIKEINITQEALSKGEFKHYMEKEIYEQPQALINTLDGRISGEDVLDNIFGIDSSVLFKKVKREGSIFSSLPAWGFPYA